MKLYFSLILGAFMLINLLSVNASSTILHSENFDNITYSCDFSNSDLSSNQLIPFSNSIGTFNVIWPSTRPTTFVVEPGIIEVSATNAPFNTTSSLKQFTSTKRGFLGAYNTTGVLKTTPSSMSVTINENSPLTQKVLMEANYFFTEAKFNKTVFASKSTKDGIQLKFKIVFSNDGMINVYSGNSALVISVPWEVNRWYHVALLADIENSTISVYVNGETLIENSAFTSLANKAIGQIFLSTITGLATVTDEDKSTVFIDDVKITSGDNVTYDVSMANASIVSATYYKVDNINGQIKQVPVSTTVANFKSKIQLSPNTTLKLYDVNGLELSDVSEIVETTKAVVIAPDGITKKMYGIELIPNPQFKVNGELTENIISTYGKNLEASVEVKNDGAIYPLMAILALYDNNGKMIKSSISKQKQALTGTTTFSANINVPIPTVGVTYKAKFMLWSSFEPIRDVSILK